MVHAGLRILIADDDAALGTMLSLLLEDMGHVVCGIEATEPGLVAAAQRERPDLMIVDANLRDGSGTDAVTAIGRIAPIPAILMSGQRPAAGSTAVVVLHKPFMYGDLAEAIRRIMAGSAAAGADAARF